MDFPPPSTPNIIPWSLSSPLYHVCFRIFPASCLSTNHKNFTFSLVEISSLKNLEDFLMGDSLCLKLFSVYFQQPECTEYVTKLLRPLLAQILEFDTETAEIGSLRSLFKNSLSTNSLGGSQKGSQVSLSSIGSSNMSLPDPEGFWPFHFCSKI